MSEKTKIEWCDNSMSAWKGVPRRLASDATWRQPVKWNRESDPAKPTTVFPSLCDWLDDEVPIEWLARFLKLIYDTPNLRWLLLTKRPELWVERIKEARNFLTSGGCADTALWLNSWLPKPAAIGGYERGRQATTSHPETHGTPPENIWIGTSVENQKYADIRIPKLLAIPAVKRFISAEPLLGPVDFSKYIGYYPVNENKSRHGRLSDDGNSKREHGSGSDGQDMATEEAGLGSVAEAVGRSTMHQKAGGTELGGRVSSSQGDDQQSSRECLRSQNSVPSLERRNTSRANDQSQGREKGQQSPGQFGAGDLFRADQACKDSARKTIQDSGRGEQRHGQAHRVGDTRDSEASGSRGKIEDDSGIIQHHGSKREPDLPASSMAIHQIIFGGESTQGKPARPCNIDWIRDGVRQCRMAGIAPFVKQLGSRPVQTLPKNAAGWSNFPAQLRDRKGGNMAEWPEDLRVREMPI